MNNPNTPTRFSSASSAVRPTTPHPQSTKGVAISSSSGVVSVFAQHAESSYKKFRITLHLFTLAGGRPLTPRSSRNGSQ